MKVHAADLLTIAAGTVLITTGHTWWIQTIGAACLAIAGIIAVRRAVRAAERRRWRHADTAGR